ncbi:unnamed protein product [Brachionus calyciflorus]|uniref:BTB domain-containing protein n=1 Tax=Brachionus calyciflorus TaxID=104777 RepID=A0A813V197_9BILA|nr:unnamed protein product [Brachionus calyciflorus]
MSYNNESFQENIRNDSFFNSFKLNQPNSKINTSSHYNFAFKKIESMFEDGKLCDVRLLCNNGTLEIRAHRVVLSSISDYFYAMFTSNLAESYKTDIEINDIDGETLKILIDYIYTGKIDLNDTNIFSILNAANFLQLENVVKHGCDFLSNNLNISNCVSIYRFSDQESLTYLKSISFKYLLDNFEKLASNNELLNELDESELADLFDDEYLNISTEEFVYEILFRWVDMNKEKRINSISKLLAKVKLPLLKASFLTKEIETNQLLSNECKCQSLMLEALIYHLMPEKFTSSPIPRTTPRKSTVGYLLCVGGIDNSRSTPTPSFIEKYDCRLDKWISFNSNINHITSTQSNTSNSSTNSNGNNINPNSGTTHTNTNALKRLQFGVAVLNSEFLYIVGGRDGLKTLNTVDCFNIVKETWTSSTPMITHRHGLQSTFLGNQPSILYAVGGHDGWSFLSTVERFDLESKTWSYVASMGNARSTLGIAVISNILYAVGGRDANVCLNSVEQFNPMTNRWTVCASMYKRRGAVAVTALNGFIYAIGGHENTSTLANSNRYDCGERYDPKNDQWTMITNIMRAREAISASNLGTNYIYIAGGFDLNSHFRNECERFDPIKNEWTKIQSLNTPRAGACLIYVPPISDHRYFSNYKQRISIKDRNDKNLDEKEKNPVSNDQTTEDNSIVKD